MVISIYYKQINTILVILLEIPLRLGIKPNYKIVSKPFSAYHSQVLRDYYE